MAVMRDIGGTYPASVTAYWNGMFVGLNNEAELQALLAGYLSTQNTNYTNYKNWMVSDVGGGEVMRTVATPLMSYVSLKYVMVVPGAPAVTSLIPNDDLRQWYRNWTYTLYTPDQLFYFSIEENVGTLSINAWSAQQSAITGAAGADSGVINGFVSGIPAAIRARVIFQVYCMVPPTPPTTTAKAYINLNLRFSEILLDFAWTIPGLAICP